MKTTLAAVIARVATAIPAMSGKVWLDESRSDTLPYAIVQCLAGGPPAHFYDGNHIERAIFMIRVYGTDAPTVAGYQGTISAAFEPKSTKLSLSVGQHVGSWSIGQSLPMRGISATGDPCYLAENRYRIESTRA